MEAPAPQDVSPGPHGSLMRNGSDISAPDTIVLIHGLWMTPHSWDKWVDRYSSRAYRVIAPAWPGLDRDIADFQAGLANLTPKQKARRRRSSGSPGCRWCSAPLPLRWSCPRPRNAATTGRSTSGPWDREAFRREILPALQGVSVAAMAKATGLSLAFCWKVRRGEKVPHPRHWEALRELGASPRP